ncbi:TetR family transcriptional regulator [Bifidobacterium sp. DSM 109958]|uniref:TetR family transcriptional regulator n=1 Tax=Bifidobacterium moraviense TaxID=2675323 RepID=A0A7Y0HYY8_9BIFI|nr:TetR/AcrR family transcriptional regulator [Bifidobacterium sp. DSM 109958]NMM99649.1 TetR family transcriptional regulator [Bifidobacterium sp. DSM 109958]
MSDAIVAKTATEAKPSKPLDRRARRTRAMLQEAMLKLLERKPLNKISVTELTELADVNRATFYAHYTDIYDMFEQIKAELIDTLGDIIARHGEEISQAEYRPLIREIFEFADAHEHLFSLLVGNQGDALYADLIAAVERQLVRLVDPIAAAEQHDRSLGAAPAHNRSAVETVRTYQFAYLAGGIVNVLQAWFQRGRREPVDFMASMVATTTRMAGIESLTLNLRLVEGKEDIRA